ncbi:MAG: zinc ribbon domain-containing protein [Clostridia bacterium]|nr:zinc ribbon domain-containing protein [Clostridia bacterium]
MPLLKYKCEACQKTFDTLVSVAKMDSVRCECGGETGRVYEGKCLFGMPGSSAGRDTGCSGQCGGCGGCSSHAH